MPDRPLAYHSLPERAGKVDTSVQVETKQPTQYWEKIALNI